MFRGNVLTPPSGSKCESNKKPSRSRRQAEIWFLLFLVRVTPRLWQWGKYVSVKRRWTPAGLHGQNTELFIVSAVRSSVSTQCHTAYVDTCSCCIWRLRKSVIISPHGIKFNFMCTALLFCCYIRRGRGYFLHKKTSQTRGKPDSLGEIILSFTVNIFSVLQATWSGNLRLFWTGKTAQIMQVPKSPHWSAINFVLIRRSPLQAIPRGVWRFLLFKRNSVWKCFGRRCL
jgi:hypothetical protein